ncbi:peptide MFS transporter [Marmoricola sp. RAF53]|uniref:peptide MFS transporter n=1 Tax=Marmoricola sp. RAF53 TaxID=3233059 RepID=UPI003F9E2999
MVVAGSGKTFFGHPGGLSTLFFTEMWERFSYYGMRAILVLYLTAPVLGPDGGPASNPGLNLDDGTAAAIYGTYTGLVYLTPVAGGWLADRVFGLRRSVLWGGLVIAAGHFLMAVPVEAMFWVGLVAIALGTGLLKPNISGLVGKLYSEEDTRRDAGFSLFYMGINIGSFLAPIVCGTLGEQYNWHLGFAAAGVGMALGVVQYVVGGRRRLQGVGEQPESPASPAERNQALQVGGVVLLVVSGLIVLLSVLGDGFSITSVTNAISIFILLVPIVYFRQLFRRKDLSEAERGHVRAFVWVFLGAAVFWMLFEQAGSTLTLFANDVTQLTVGGDAYRPILVNQPSVLTESSLYGWDLPASWLQSVNPLLIVIFAPVFSAIWLRLGDRAPRTSVKFAIALVGIGLSFAMLAIPMQHYLETGQKAGVSWLLIVYLVQTWAELLLSPNGLSATTKLAPTGTIGQMLALWFLATSVGTTMGGQIARLTADDPTQTFVLCGVLAISFGVVMFVMSRRISALMGAVH